MSFKNKLRNANNADKKISDKKFSRAFVQRPLRKKLSNCISLTLRNSFTQPNSHFKKLSLISLLIVALFLQYFDNKRKRKILKCPGWKTHG